MWNYQNTDERTKARTEHFNDLEGMEFLGAGAGTIVEMQNVMLIPVDFSILK